jgi:hypothetical protein
MKKTKIYYHILEYSNYGNVGYQGYFLTLEEAKKQSDKLTEYFPNSYFQIESSNNKKEPVNTTI